MSAAVPHFGIAVAVHLGGTPGGLGLGVAAPVVPHALVDERKDTDVS